MPSKKSSYKKDAKQKIKLDQLTRRSVQITGFGMAMVLISIRIVATAKGVDSGISEVFIAGLIGVGVSGTWIKK